MQPSEFVQNMMALWRKPTETANAQIAAEQYCDALSKFTPAQLDAGWAKLRDEHDRAAWPLISECRKAVLSAASVNAPPRQTAPGRLEYPDFANASMRSQMAIIARSEGWLLGLWDFCNEKNRLPHAHEVGRIKNTADRANHLAGQLDGTNKLHRTILGWWSAMRERERRLSLMVKDAA